MSKNYATIIHFMLPLTTFYRSGAPRSDVYKWDAFVTSWRFYNRAWQPQRHDRPPETSGTLWIHRGALTNQRCSLATGCGIKYVAMVTPCIRFPFPTKVFCNGFQGFMTGCPCGVWYCGSTTCHSVLVHFILTWPESLSEFEIYFI